jgi:hypothetical protein
MLYDQFVYPLIFWTGCGARGILESEELSGSMPLSRKVSVSFFWQPRDRFIHQMTSFREEFICPVSGHCVNFNIKFLAQAQRGRFAREDETHGGISKGIPRESGLGTLISPSLIDSDQYWRHPATKCFAISTQLGCPTLFPPFTMNT